MLLAGTTNTYVNSGPPASFNQLENVFSTVLGLAISFAAIVLLFYLIMGGIKFITSSGDPQKTSGAKNTITYALGGVLLIILSYLILQIIATITNTPAILNFKIFQ
jgi:uncharacterized membrane protein YqgA involved in biofilm formation